MNDTLGKFNEHPEDSFPLFRTFERIEIIKLSHHHQSLHPLQKLQYNQLNQKTIFSIFLIIIIFSSKMVIKIFLFSQLIFFLSIMAAIGALSATGGA